MGWGSSWDDKPSSSTVGEGGGVNSYLAIIKDNKLLNKIPTHDPYTNPDCYLYYECECGQRLDPKTKRFAELNNCASNAGWKIRWGSQHYIPYCVECAKEKGIE